MLFDIAACTSSISPYRLKDEDKIFMLIAVDACRRHDCTRSDKPVSPPDCFNIYFKIPPSAYSMTVLKKFDIEYAITAETSRLSLYFNRLRCVRMAGLICSAPASAQILRYSDMFFTQGNHRTPHLITDNQRIRFLSQRFNIDKILGISIMFTKYSCPSSARNTVRSICIS